MTPAQFRRQLGTRGPALERWPEADRDAARLLLAASARARRRLLTALADDNSLDAPIDPAILARLTAAVRTGIALEPRLPSPRWAITMPLQWSALAACTLLGVWLGTPAATPSPSSPAVLASMQITALDPPWTEASR